MSRHFCCLTFDFDAMSGFVARGMVTPTPVSRGEFGAVGARRVLALLAEHEIRSTWFRNGPRELDSAVSGIFLGFQAAKSR